ncbi:MAG TPA: phosphoglycerate kinase [Armatimonadota bacterium]|nr:phosphoglycerate kinase [Armatimonadota bacterium]
MDKKTIDDVDVTGKQVLVRVDYNVALDAEGRVLDDTRISASLDTIRTLIDRGARVILISHLGRPRGKPAPDLSLAPVARRLQDLLGRPVAFLHDCVGDEVNAYVHHKLKDGEVVLLENVRFHPEEETNDPAFAKQLAALCELYVNDAFGAAHRAHASTEGVAHYRTAVAGLLMAREIDHLGAVIESPERPLTAILGGSKVSTKVGVIRNLLERVKVDHLLLGGGMTYAFLKALGKPVGASRVDDESLAMARDLVKNGIPPGVALPTDVVVTDRGFDIKKPLNPEAQVKIVPAEQIPEGWQGADIGPETAKRFGEIIRESKTVIWNGPVGVFEIEAFAKGTNAIAHAVAASGATSVVGGGESVTAVHQAGVADQISWISTGGGASLEFLEGKDLPGLKALEDKTPKPEQSSPAGATGRA